MTTADQDLLRLQVEVGAGRTLEEAAIALGLLAEDDPLRARTLAELRHELQLFTAPDFDVRVDPERVLDPDTGRPSHGRVAEFLAEIHRFATVEDVREVLVYDPRAGVYRAAAPLVGGMVERLVRQKTTARFVTEVLGHLERLTYRPREAFDAQPGLVVANGVLDPTTGTLGGWDSVRLDTIRLPVRYDPEAECPAFARFLRQVVSREDARVLQEGVGYCLLKAMPLHTAFLLVGEGANGKSTFLQVLRTLLGPGNVAGETLQSLGGRFGTAGLAGKLANAAPDLPSWPVKDAGTFKALVGGDHVRAERKYAHPFVFKNVAKLWFSCNRVPRTEDESHAYFRRWRIVSFPRTFGPEEADPHLLGKLTTEGELSGVLTWAAEGLQRLLAQGGFSDAPTVEETRDAYVRLSDPVAAFVDACCLKDPGAEPLPKDDVYEAYESYCRDRGLSVLSKPVFVREVGRVAPWTRQSQRTIGGQRGVRCWEGLALAPADEEG